MRSAFAVWILQRTKWNWLGQSFWKAWTNGRFLASWSLWFCCSMPWNLGETWVGTSLGSPRQPWNLSISTATIAQLVACFFWSLPDSSMGSWLAGKIARSGMASPLEMEHLSSDGDDREGRILACGIWQFFCWDFPHRLSRFMQCDYIVHAHHHSPLPLLVIILISFVQL